MPRITDKTELTSVASGDKIPIIDVSDTSANAAGTLKNITKENLINDVPESALNGIMASLSSSTKMSFDFARTSFVPLNPTTGSTQNYTFTRLSKIYAVIAIPMRGAGGDSEFAGKVSWTVHNGADSPTYVNPSGNTTSIRYYNHSTASAWGFFIVVAIGEKA